MRRRWGWPRCPASQIVDFDQAYARAVVQSREQRRVRARRQRYGYARLKIVCRRQIGPSQFHRLSGVILPVVICNKERSVPIAQFQHRIGQRIRHARSA